MEVLAWKILEEWSIEMDPVDTLQICQSFLSEGLIMLTMSCKQAMC